MMEMTWYGLHRACEWWSHMFMSGFTVFKQSLTKSFCFTLKNINCCFTDTNQQDLTYGKKYSIEMLCCNVGKWKSFSRFLSLWNIIEFWKKKVKKEKEKKRRRRRKKKRMIVKIVKINLGLSLVLLWAVWGQFIFG